jgi:hypothetical protein
MFLADNSLRTNFSFYTENQTLSESSQEKQPILSPPTQVLSSIGVLSSYAYARHLGLLPRKATDVTLHDNGSFLVVREELLFGVGDGAADAADQVRDTLALRFASSRLRSNKTDKRRSSEVSCRDETLTPLLATTAKFIL